MKKTLFAIPGLVLALSGSAFASQTWEDQSARTALAAMDSAPAATSGVTVRGVPMAGRVPAGSPTFFANFLASGPAEPGVPCFGCVNGAPGTALGIPPPYNFIPSGTVQQYNLAWTTLTFKGTCKIAIVLASGKTKIDSVSFNVPGVNPQGAYDIGLNFKAESFSGPALATGKLTCGSKSSIVTAHVIFQ
jgi:hypothetical protein